jgi:hypothetical protein
LEEYFNRAAPAPTVPGSVPCDRGGRHGATEAKVGPLEADAPPHLAAVNLHAAGIDVGAEAHYVAVPPSDDPQPVRCFGAYTVDLAALADWLALCWITTVALEATGVSWIPLFE